MAGESEEGGLHAFHPRPALARIDGQLAMLADAGVVGPHFLISAVAFLFNLLLFVYLFRQLQMVLVPSILFSLLQEGVRFFPSKEYASEL